MRLRGFAFAACIFAGVLAAPARLAARKRTPDQQQAKLFQAKLKKDDQVRHALDRLTFGPRPGDDAQVRRMGLKKWIDQQLHPERVAENAYLEAKLAPLESL